MRDIATTLLELAGFGLVIVGVWMLFVPAAFIVAGVGAILLGWRFSR